MFSARFRLAFGLTSIVVSVLLVAMNIGIIPDYQEVEMKGRSQLCEAIAANCSAVVRQRDLRRMEDILGLIVERNEDILSAGVRRADGSLPVAVGAHDQTWERLPDDEPTDTQVLVPIRANNRRWGSVELRFRPSAATSWLGMLIHPQTLFYVFVAAITFVLTVLYLGKTLRKMDPSKVVPGRVRSALDTLAEGLLVLDNKHRIMLANQAFAEIMGKAPEKLLGHHASDLPWITNDSSQATSYPWEMSLTEEAALAGMMLKLRDHSGKLRTFIVNCTPIPGDDGKNRGVLASFEDVTQLEETQQELSRSKEAADAANTAKSEFLARMSHEIRTPMNAILGFTDVLRRGFETTQEERQDYLETIHASGKHLLKLINDILDLSKVESGRVEVERISCAPFQLVREAVAVLQGQAEEKGISLECEAPAKLPETILTDPVRFRQLLTNLIGNAIKFTEQGSVRVVAELDHTSGEPRLAISVIDTGVGIPTETLDRIFEPFVQADTSVTRKYGGTGLGLAISRRFAEALGGGLTVESKYGKGSVFSFTVDTGSLEGVRMLYIDELPKNDLASGARNEIDGGLPQAQILVVDDGDSNRKLINLVLSRAGATVQTAKNGKEAVDATRRHDFDLILMDIQMPVMDGHTATRMLRKEHFTKPIIALTADAMKGTEQQCKASGCTSFLTKPIDMDQLIESVAQTLREQGHEWTLSQTRSPDPAAAFEFGPLHSTLPTDDHEFCEIIAEFETRLQDKIEAMQAALADDDFERLGELAHWLKGSGGTAGFHPFTAPATKLQQLATTGTDLQQMATLLAEIEGLAAAVVVPGLASFSKC